MGLVLTRAPGERIIVKCPNGERLTIAVNFKTHEGKTLIKVMVEAPQEYKILRAELPESR